LSPAAGILTGALLAWGLYQLARRRPATDDWLLAVLGVWAPVFALGMFAWNVPSRYTEMSLMPMLLCAFAFAQRATDWLLAQVKRADRLPAGDRIAAALVGLCAIGPVGAAGVVDAGYRIHPDHVGAAQFMRSLQITDDDVLLAEDVLQQTYYLGKVDYWLIGPHVARKFIKSTPDGGVVDFYTGTPVIATGAMLDKVLQENQGRRIFVIGSGEGQSDKRRTVRGPELSAALVSERFETIFMGRDGLTRVLRAVPGAIVSSPSTAEQAQQDADALANRAKAAQDKAHPPTTNGGSAPRSVPDPRE